MCFAIVRVDSDPAALLESILQVPGDISAGVILEKLGIRPLHSTFGQQILRGFPRTAQTLEQKNSFRIFVQDAGGNVPPGLDGDFVARVASKSIDAAPAPD